MKYIQLLYLVFIISITLFLHHFPTYYAAINTPNGYVYSGQATWFDPWDINVYVSAIREGQQGNLLYHNRYTTLKHNPLLVYPLYTSIGYFFRSVDPFFLFHVLAMTIGVALVIILYILVGVFISGTWWRLVSVLLIANGGGYGFLLKKWTELPDLTTPVITFYEGFQRGHVGLVLLCYLSALVLFYKGVQTKRKLYYMVSPLLLIVSLIFHPYNIVFYIFYTILFSGYLYKKNKLLQPLYATGIILFILFWFELFFMKYMLSSPGFSGLMGQKISSPNVWKFILTYSMLFLSAGIAIFTSKKREKMSFLMIWIIVGIVLSFIPSFGIFYLRGLLFPIIILALWGIQQLIKKYSLYGILFFLIFVIVTLSTQGYIFYRRISEVGGNNKWFYISQNIKDGLNFLEQEKKQSGVLSSYYVGNIIPAHTNNLVMYGHHNVSLNTEKSLVFIHYFYGNMIEDNAQIKSFLLKNNLRYVFYGPEERALTRQYDVKSNGLKYAFLDVVYQNADVTIYRY